METKCPLKSHHIYTWDENGKIDSPFAHEPDETHFEVRLDVLRQLHVPDHDLQRIRELRDVWLLTKGIPF